MSDLYHLHCPIRQILTEWLDTRPPIPNTFDGVPSVDHDEDYIFSNDQNEIEAQEDTVGPAIVPMFPPGLCIPSLEFDPKKLEWGRRIDNQSTGNAVFQVMWDGHPFVLKVVCFNLSGRLSDTYLSPLRITRLRKIRSFAKAAIWAELNAYKRLLRSGLCDTGVVPQPCGYFHIWGQQHVGWLFHVKSWPYKDWLREVTNPVEYPRAILFERIPNVTRLPRDQFTHQNMFDLFDTVEKIHRAGIVHWGMEARNMLWDGKHFVIVGFDNADVLPEGQPVSKSDYGQDLAEMWENFIFNRR